jgi:hypothetical protein
LAAASLDAAPECADGRTLTGAVDVHALSLIFSKLIVHKQRTPAQPSVAQTAPRQSANSGSPAAAKSPAMLPPIEIAPS